MARSTPPAGAKIGKKMDFLAAALGDALKPDGFQRKSRRLWRESGDGENRCFQVLDLQGDTWNEGIAGRFCVNFGVQLPAVCRLASERMERPWQPPDAGQPYVSECCVHTRLGGVLPGGRESWWTEEMAPDRDIWFSITSDTDLETLAAVVCRSAREYILPWLGMAGQLDGVFAAQGGGRFHQKSGCRLAAGVLLGRKSEVADLFAKHGSGWFRSVSFQNVKGWLESYGVDVAAVEYAPPRQSPGLESRMEAIESARASADAAMKVLADSPVPFPGRLPEMLDADVECYRTRIGLAYVSPIDALLAGSSGETRRQVVLMILQKLVQAPIALPSLRQNVFGDIGHVHDHVWGNLLTPLLKGLRCDEVFARDLLEALLALTSRHCQHGMVCITFPYPFAEIVHYLYQDALPWSEALKPQVRALLEGIRSEAVAAHEQGLRSVLEAAARPDADELTKTLAAQDHAAVRERISNYPEQSFEKAANGAIGMLRKWLKRDASGEELLEIEQDDWGRQLNEALADFPGGPGILAGLLKVLANETPARPTAKFNKRLTGFLERIAQGQNPEAAADWLDTLLRGYARSGLDGEWATTRPRPGVGAFLGETSGRILMGMIHLARLWDADRFAPALAVAMDAAFTVVPGVSMRSQKTGSAAIEALGSSGAGRVLLTERLKNTKKPAIWKAIESALRA